MWMNSTSSLPALTSSAMSTTGPQTRLWQSAGVANSRTTGFLPTTSAKSLLCIEDGGIRVSIEARSPPTSASVGVWMRGAGSPRPGIGSSAAFTTASPGAAEVAATSRLSRRTIPKTS
jgi:hypothetical protein